MKRFYKIVNVKPAGSQFAVVLDARPMKTPGGVQLTVPTTALAEAIAAEWAGQGETIDERTMPLTKFANTAIDRIRADRPLAIKQLESFAGHDLVCYRASEPPALIAREAAAWDGPLAWAREKYGLDLKVTQGVLSVAQTAVSRLEQMLSQHDEFSLTGLVTAAGILKSLVLALSLADGRLDAIAVHAAAHVDERFQAEKWGRDAEAEMRSKALLAELEAAERFMRLAAA